MTDLSPINRDLSPLVIYRSYENCLGFGLLPTPNVRPLRRAIYKSHPVIELEHALNLSRNERTFSICANSEICEYKPGIYLNYLIGIYGEKIARVSFVDGEESTKRNLKDEFSPRTKEIYSMLEAELYRALFHATLIRREEEGRRGGQEEGRRGGQEEGRRGRQEEGRRGRQEEGHRRRGREGEMGRNDEHDPRMGARQIAARRREGPREHLRNGPRHGKEVCF